MVSALLAPIMSLSSELEQYIDNIEIQVQDGAKSDFAKAEAMVAAEAKENIEAEVERLICSKFGLNDDETYIVVAIDSEDISAVKITDINVFLDDIDKSGEIKEYLSELFLRTSNINIIKKGAKE